MKSYKEFIAEELSKVWYTRTFNWIEKQLTFSGGESGYDQIDPKRWEFAPEANPALSKFFAEYYNISPQDVKQIDDIMKKIAKRTKWKITDTTYKNGNYEVSMK